MLRRLNSQRTIIVLSIMMALQMTSFVMIQPLFARRFNEFGAGVEALGISAMAYALTGALAAPFMGALADRLGRRPLVLGSLAAYLGAFCGYLLAPTAGILIGLRGFAGAFAAGLMPAVTGLAADLAPQDRQAQWMGFVIGGASCGWIVGPIAGGEIYDRWGYSAALTVSIIIAVLTLGVALLFVPESRLSYGFRCKTRIKPAAGETHEPEVLCNHPGEDAGGSFSHHKLSKRFYTDAERRATSRVPIDIKLFPPSLRRTLPDSLSTFIVLLFILFAVLFAWAFIEPQFMFYAYNDLGWSSSMLGLMMSMYGFAMVFGELALGQLSDRLGRKPVIIIGLVLFSAQFIGLAFFRNHLLIALAFGIAGLGNALYDPALSAFILDISPMEHRSRILGIKYTAGSTGSILGPAVVVLVASSLNVSSIFLIAAGVVLLAIVAGLAIKAVPVNPKNKPQLSPLADAGALTES